MRIIKFLFIISLITYLTSCSAPPEPEFEPNPYDTDHPDFVLPKTTITEGPESGDVIDKPQVTFSWSGNESVKDYSHRFITDEWSDWTTETSAAFDYLDEKEYTFAVRSRHTNGVTIEEDYPEINFTVDAVQGPAVMFYPRRKEVSGTSTAPYDILAEEVDALLGAKIVLLYDNNRIRVAGVETGDHLGSNGGAGVLFYDIDNEAGSVVIELAVTGGEPKGVSGSGSIARVELEPLTTGAATIDIDAGLTGCRDVNNDTININELVGGRVEVK